MEAVAVVIPARDEQDRIGQCLQSIRAAIDFLPVAHADTRIFVCVALDSCTDDTRAIVSDYPWAHAIELSAANVGIARRTGIEFALRELGADPRSVWIANTDADSTVPQEWLLDQLQAASQGFDAVIGSVLPRVDELSAMQVSAWDKTHPRGPATGHVHGANLGFRASSYLAAGQFEPLREHEDVQLVRRLQLTRAEVMSNGTHPVTTSARSIGRTPGGYASYLAALGSVAG